VPAFDVLAQLERRWSDPERELLRFYGRRYTAAEILASSRNVAAALHRIGIGPGSTVAIDLTNRPEFFETLLGAWRAGATVTPVNTQLRSEEIRHQLHDSGSRLIVYETRVAERVEEALRDLPGSIARVVIDPRLPVDEGTAAFDAWARPGTGKEVGAEPPENLFVIYTSGTTGRPKGAILTAGNVYHEALALRQALGLEAADRMIVVLPLFHVNNLMLGFATFLVGGSVTILRWFEVDDFVREVARARPTFFSGVPTVYKRLLDVADRIDRSALGSLRFAVCGAAPMPVTWLNEFQSRFGIPIVEGYGLTEGTVASTVNPRHGCRKVGSVGIPLPGQEVRVVDEADRELPPGEVGEVVVRGPNVMKGYLGRESETRETLRDGWLHTGDLGRFDDDGYLYLVDRMKDLIIRGGENVYPKEVENVLLEHPDIADAAVVGAPDEAYGERVIAFVVRHDEALSRETVLDYCRQRLAAFKCPTEVLFVGELPRNSVGKVQKPALRQQAPVRARSLPSP